MFKIGRKNIVVLAVVMLVSAGLIIVPFGAAFAQIGQDYDRYPTKGRTPEKMIFDVAFVRTTGILGIVLGTAAFVVSYPFSYLGGNSEQAYQRLVVDPAQYTFKRPLGAF